MSSQFRALRARPARALAAATGAVMVLLALPAPASAATATLYVDQHNAACTNTGSGTATQPYCTIGAAAAVATAGQTVQVAAGTYNEDVNPAHSGSAGAPIVFAAASGATVTVGQGQVDAFTVSSRSFVTVQGFTVTGTTGYGISVGGSSNISVIGNKVSLSGQPVSGSTKAGIYLSNTNSSLVQGNTSFQNSDHGIYVTGTSTGNTISGNLAYLNAEQYQRNANGINVTAPGNSVIGNTTHDNEDTGINVYPGADNTLVADNVTYNNGDHGIDDLNVTGGVIVGNTVFHNCTDGINVEGTSGNYTVENNISVDNAIAVVNPTPMAKGVSNTCNRRTGNIGIYDSAPSSTTADYNISYMSVANSAITGSAAVWYDWAGTSYTAGQLASLQGASAEEAHGVWANPHWTSTSLSAPDFHLVEGSPAIDSANSGVSGEQATDLEGHPRVDDPSTPNTGAGTRSYDDRGAYELQPSGGGSTATAPGAPQNLTAGAGTGTASLAWSAPASDGGAAVTGYNLYRGTSSGAETLLASGLTGTAYTDTAVTGGTTYYYKVAAVNSVGTGAMSNEAAATPVPGTPPSAPLNLTAATGARKGVAIQWSVPASIGTSQITGYNVYRSTSSGTETLLASGVSSTSYQDNGAKRGVTYFYQVTAVNAAGQSPMSNEASAPAR